MPFEKKSAPSVWKVGNQRQKNKKEKSTLLLSNHVDTSSTLATFEYIDLQEPISSQIQ